MTPKTSSKNKSKDKETRKAVKQQKKVARRQQFGQIKEAFRIQRSEDPSTVLILIAVFIGTVLIFAAAGYALHMFWTLLICGILVGLLAAFIVFGRRARSLSYRKAEGQPGAAGWVLENLKGSWRTSTAVQANSQFDIIHRVIGQPGIILVGEGNVNRVKNLLTNEKKSISKLAGTTPIYEVIVSESESGKDDRIPVIALSGLEKHVRKLPKNISRTDIDTLEKRLQAIKPKTHIPRGPLPSQAKARNLNRTMKRKS